MNYTVIKKLAPLEKIVETFPLSKQAHQRVQHDRQEVKAILEGRDTRFLMIVGPCSAWPKEAVLAYAERLLKLNEKLKHALKIIMRVYIQKPRTTKGWTGPVNQPDVFSLPDIEAGLKYTREMMVKVVEMGLSIADEALLIQNAKGFMDLLSWVAIGARSTENQEHRIFASALNCAVGLKNPTHGALDIGVNSIVAAQYPHVAVFYGEEVQTHGNPHAHLVLRGSHDAPNYAVPHLEKVMHLMKKHDIDNPAVIIDASHDNCLANGKKDHRLQPRIVFEILDSLKHRPDLRQLVKGFMLESFLKDGRQSVQADNRAGIDLMGLSITDPCLGWDETESLLLQMAEVN